MDIAANYRKLKGHFNKNGLFYAIWRGIKYLAFLIKSKKLITNGTLMILYKKQGVKFFWNNIELTENIGLNSSLCVNKKWSDSSQAKWKIIKKDNKTLILKSSWRYFSVTQTWRIELKTKNTIAWTIEEEAPDDLQIDERKITLLVNNKYKRWINSYEEGEFSRITGWRAVVLNDSSSRYIGVRGVKEEPLRPAMLFDFSGNEFEVTPVIQNTSQEIGARCLEARVCGSHKSFSSEITLFEKEDSLDNRIEEFRHNLLSRVRDSLFTERQKRLKVLLVNLPWQKGRYGGVRAGSRWPHIKDQAEKDYLPFPFFLAHAASLLRKNNIEVYIIDAIADQLSEEEFLLKLDNIYPDLVVAEISTPSLEYDLRLLKKINPDTHIALCGPDVNIREPEFLRKNKFINYVLNGEYEHTLLDLARCLENNKSLSELAGLSYRDDSGVVHINPARTLADLNSLPWPLREDLPMDKYNDNPGGMPLPSVQMLASRGCPYDCAFCLWPQVMYQGRNYRARDINDVIDEMEYLVRNVGFKSVYFDDDTFNIGKERMLNFCREIKRRGLHSVPWAIMARADLMDREILQEMKSAGLWAVKYGVESFNQELVDKIGKSMDIRKSIEMIKFTKTLGIKTHLTFTFGLPGETRQTIQKTIDSCLQISPDSAQFSITTPFPGTTYFNNLEKRGFIQSKNWADFDGNRHSVISTDNLTARQLEDARNYAHKIWREHVWEKNFRAIGFKDYCRKFLLSIRNNGLGRTLAKALLFILRFFNFSNQCRYYLQILGIMSGHYAYRGPHQIQIDLTNSCNNDCLGCWCRSPLLSEKDKQKRAQEASQILTFDRVRDLIDEISGFGTKELFFSGGGEPLMHPDLFKIIRYAKRKKFICYLNTNFTLVSEAVVKEIIDSGLDYLTVSVWAGKSSTYVKTHPNKSETDFYRILDMLTCLNKLKQKSLPHIKLYNVICNVNYQELNEMVDFAVETRSESVEFAVIDTIPGATDKLILSEEERKNVLEQCECINGKRGVTIINLEHFMRRLSDSGANRAEYDSEFVENMPCYVGWLFARILANGDVNSCLKSHRFPVGNIYRQSFRQAWNSSHQAEFRKESLNFGKEQTFFARIGNDPGCEAGCYKSCDNIGSNIQMHSRLNNLSFLDKIFINMLSVIYKPNANGKKQ